MPPQRTPGRLLAIVDAASEVFASSGYAGAQMAEVARVAGVSVGTLYNYVEGKGALLLLVAERPFVDIAEGRALPVATPDPGQLLPRLDSLLKRHVRVRALEHANASKLPVDDVGGQLASIVGELFDLIEASRVAADAIERSARDAPDLGALFYRRVRATLLDQLVRYTRKINRVIPLPAPLTPELAARSMLETVTWWARHRHRDPSPPDIDDVTARGVAIAVVSALLLGRDATA